MKAILVLLIIMISISYGFIEIKHENGDDILAELKKKNNGVIVVMFTVNADMGTDLAQTNYDFEYHLVHGILYNYPSFKFAKVNANDPAYVNLVKSCGISVADLYNSPSVLISEDQRGEWIHGDRTMGRISKTAENYNLRK